MVVVYQVDDYATTDFSEVEQYFTKKKKKEIDKRIENFMKDYPQEAKGGVAWIDVFDYKDKTINIYLVPDANPEDIQVSKKKELKFIPKEAKLILIVSSPKPGIWMNLYDFRKNARERLINTLYMLSTKSVIEPSPREVSRYKAMLKLKEKGIYLMYAVDFPLTKLKPEAVKLILKANIGKLLKKLERVPKAKNSLIGIFEDEPFEALYEELKKEGFNVYPQPIISPVKTSEGSEELFYKQMKELIEKTIT